MGLAIYKPNGPRRATAILFHGFKGNGAQMVNMFHDIAALLKIALVAPTAAGDQWQAHAGSADMATAKAALDQVFVDGAKHVASAGHSYGTRMAAVFGTTDPRVRSVTLAHGRYVPEDLGPHHVRALFTGTPTDNQFDFDVMRNQWRQWPGSQSALEVFGGNHYPQPDELAAIGHFMVAG